LANQLHFGPHYGGSAEFSPDRRYRYALYRTWDEEKSKVLFIGLNPSTADESVDDPTIRRCKRFAFDWGYGGLIMANLFALRATDPKTMMADPAPVGPYNSDWLVRLYREAETTVAAWGNYGGLLNRDKIVMGFLPKMKCLGLTKQRHPRHPLYVQADTLLMDMK